MPRTTLMVTTAASCLIRTMVRRDKAAAITKHSLLIAGHRTSISLEEMFWRALRRQAERRGLSVAGLVAEIDAARGDANLSSAVRVHLFAAACGRSGDEGDDVS